MNRMISYVRKDTWIHRLSGVTKLVFFLLWCITSALTYDTRILLVMIAVTIAVFVMSKTTWKQVAPVFRLVLFFMVLNVAAIFLLSPYQGCEIYHHRTVLAPFLPGHDLTAEELFYLFNVVIKYFAITPASLNGIGIPYTAAYSVAIALRYIPDVQDDYHRIKNAQEARGIEMSGKAKLTDRIRRTSSIIFPLLFSAMDRIDVVSNAMELRGFGKKKRRTWYAHRKLAAADILVMAGTAAFCIFALVFTFHDGDRFYNPFV